MNKNNKEIIIDNEFSKLIPPLSDEEFTGLKESILSDGCRDPIVLWNDVLLDGHNRYKICMENGICFSRVEKNFDSREQAKIWILENQLGRRNINAAQRIDLTEKLFGLKAKADAKQRQKERKGEQPGASKEKLPDLGQSRDKLGQKARVSGKTYAKGIKIKTNNPSLWKECLDGNKSINEAEKELKENERRELKEKERLSNADEGAKIKLTDKDIDFRLGDFKNILKDIPDDSIDLIITDPPYGEEYLFLWNDLSQLAKRVLKPNGFCIAYSGLMYLPDVMNKMGNHLSYYWTFALIYPKTYNRVLPRNILQGWKAFVVYQKGFKKINKMFFDIIEGMGRAKNNHNWEQSNQELKTIIEFFSRKNDLILDPMAGSGSTLIITKKLGRQAIGVELNRNTYNAAKKRIKEELNE